MNLLTCDLKYIVPCKVVSQVGGKEYPGKHFQTIHPMKSSVTAPWFLVLNDSNQVDGIMWLQLLAIAKFSFC
jgi:hypothetical protein